MENNIDFALNDHFYNFVDDWNYKFYFNEFHRLVRTETMHYLNDAIM